MPASGDAVPSGASRRLPWPRLNLAWIVLLVIVLLAAAIFLATLLVRSIRRQVSR